MQSVKFLLNHISHLPLYSMWATSESWSVLMLIRKTPLLIRHPLNLSNDSLTLRNKEIKFTFSQWNVHSFNMPIPRMVMNKKWESILSNAWCQIHVFKYCNPKWNNLHWNYENKHSANTLNTFLSILNPFAFNLMIMSIRIRYIRQLLGNQYEDRGYG